MVQRDSSASKFNGVGIAFITLASFHWLKPLTNNEGGEETPQVAGIIRTVQGLVGPVSAYCDWVRYQDKSATSMIVAAHKIVLSRFI